MFPSAQAFTASHAERWRAAARPLRFVRTVLPMLWAVAVIAALIGPYPICTPEDPSICGPDRRFDVAFTICLATPLLLMWMPSVGCLAGLVYGTAEVMFDPETQARTAFTVHGVLCLMGLLWLRRALKAQAAVALELSAPTKIVVAQELRRTAGVARRRGRLSLALVVGVAGLMSFGWYVQKLSQEDQHLQRALVQDVRVVDLDEDSSTISVGPDNELGGSARRTVDVLDTAHYKIGQEVPIQLAPNDPGWIRLVAEPVDQGGWLGLAVGGWLWCGLVLAREHARRKALQTLLRSEQPMCALRADTNDPLRVELLPIGEGGPLFARFLPGWSDTVPDEPEGGEGLDVDRWEDDLWGEEANHAFGKYWREGGPEDEADYLPPPPHEAVLIGPLRYGAWSLLYVDEELLLPGRPLTSGRDDSLRLWWDRLLAHGPQLWRTPVDEPVNVAAGRAVPLTPAITSLELDLPASASPSSYVRALGALELLAGLVGGPVVAAWWWSDDAWFPAVGAVLSGGSLVIGGVDRLVRRITLSKRELLLCNGRRWHHIPWDALHGVRQEGGRLFVAWKPVHIVAVGPFALQNSASAEDRARELGTTMLRLREQSLAYGSPEREHSSRPDPVWLLLALYAAGMAATLWRFG